MGEKADAGLLETKDLLGKTWSRASSPSNNNKSPSPIDWVATTPGDALHKATSLGDTDAVARILKTSPSYVDTRNTRGRTVLHEAALQDRHDIVEILLQRGADVNARSPMGYTPLTFAAERGFTEVMLTLIDHGADLDAQTIYAQADDRGYAGRGHGDWGHTPLHQAARRDDPAAVHLLAVKGASVNAVTSNRRTAQQIALDRGRSTSVLILSAFGTDPYLRNVQGDDSFDYTQALEEPQRSEVEGVLSKWKMARGKKGDLDLTEIQKSDMSQFVDTRGKVDLVAMLCWAAGKGNTTIVEYALDVSRSEDAPIVNSRNQNGWTALHYAASGGEPKVAIRLLDRGAAIDHPTKKHRWTPLLLASEKGRRRTVTALLDRGADLLAKTHLGESAFDLAQAGQHRKTLGVLAERVLAMVSAVQDPQRRELAKMEYRKATSLQKPADERRPQKPTDKPSLNPKIGGTSIKHRDDRRGSKSPQHSHADKSPTSSYMPAAPVVDGSAANPPLRPDHERHDDQDLEPSSDSASDDDASTRLSSATPSNNSFYNGTFDGALSSASSTGPELIQSKTFDDMIETWNKYSEYKANDRKVKIAILDTGFDSQHRDWQRPRALRFRNHKPEGDEREPPQRDRIREFKDFCVQGPAQGHGDGDGLDVDGHGTQVTGIILRLAPRAEVYVARICEGNRNRGLSPQHQTQTVPQGEDSANPQPDAVAAAVDWAIDRKVDIINMSFGFGLRLRPLVAALKRAKKAKILVFAAMSNDGNNSPEGAAWPARELAFAIGVHSCKEGGRKTSNFTPPHVPMNPNLMVVGEGVVTHWPEAKGGGFRRDDGTSFSTPVAAAMAALVLAFVYQGRCKKERAEAERLVDLEELRENEPMSRLMMQGMGRRGENENFTYLRPTLLWADYRWWSPGEDTAEKRRQHAWGVIKDALGR